MKGSILKNARKEKSVTTKFSHFSFLLFFVRFFCTYQIKRASENIEEMIKKNVLAYQKPHKMLKLFFCVILVHKSFFMFRVMKGKH